jgi:hypothetical protein
LDDLGLPAGTFHHDVPSPGPEWARKLLGEAYFRKPFSIRLWDVRLTDDDMKSLEFLRLTGTKITGSSFGDLRQLTRLRTMFLTGIPFSDRGMEAISTLPAPTNLKLDGTTVTDDGLAHMENLVSLERLQLDRTAITDRGLEHLGKLTSLEILSLTGTRIRGDTSALEHLHGLKKLKHLILNLVPSAETNEALTRLRESLPGCEIW